MPKPIPTDTRVLALINQVKQQRADLKALDHPTYRTNCSFSWTGGAGKVVDNVNIRTQSVEDLIRIGAFLDVLSARYGALVTEMQVDAQPFSWGGYTAEDWLHDIKILADSKQINARRAKLAALEARLDAVISPELRREMELERLELEIGSV